MSGLQKHDNYGHWPRKEKPVAPKEKEPSDSEWVRLQRLEESRREWLFEKVKSIVAWAVGALTALWAAFDAFTKFMDWMKK